jgi:XRE family transcriptional regulator, fatty acid utilization regulator
MSDNKLYAGHAVRRIRRASGLTQSAMGEALGISPSYLNLIERNQRPMTAAIMLRLAERFDFDARSLSGATPGGGIEAIRRRLTDPLFADLKLDRLQIEDWLAAAPDAAEAFARAFDRLEGAVHVQESDAIGAVRKEIERWRNHFADLDVQAESLADELRLGGDDIYSAMADRLRVKHRLSVRILPVDIMPDRLQRLDMHSRQLQLSELLDAAGRNFALASQLAQAEAKVELDALAAGGDFTEAASMKMFRRHLVAYFAASLIMPYSRFLRACENTGYDIGLLQRRFAASYEQVAHRLTTLQRVGARGLPFFMIRIDRAGHSSKRYSGASNSPLVETDLRCPLWSLHQAFDRPGVPVHQLVELESVGRQGDEASRLWFTMARTVQPQSVWSGGTQAEFVIGLGLEAKFATSLSLARGKALESESATRIGLGCRACTRPACSQRSAPPQGRVLVFNEFERGLTPFNFVADE